ncbi:hypothetical protein BRYFOR_09139 [Marvinbryantia formatexigens DSM 14469]|uniref:HTH luxR-type domain-containing protein n=1 Tax=Marvinbryantia formatexigens DSM 14469 TaxID=478749 RepID=C6LKF2_9FIRM|nr:hypothetical protein BRYFOR_09139 [Marvinbryantia formatexigens DSM 14469]
MHHFSGSDKRNSIYGLGDCPADIGGATPAVISERLCISVTTAYKHIANMYKKMNVTNRQEFIARLYEKPSEPSSNQTELR